MEKVIALIMGGMYSTFGAVVHYLYQVVKDDKNDFSFPLFIVNGIFGFFIGQLVGSFLPDPFVYKDGILLISGFLVYQILDMLEDSGLNFLMKKLNK